MSHPTQPVATGLLLSIAQVAESLSISRRTLERLIAAGEFPQADLYIGKMPRWIPDTLTTWIDQQRGGSR